MGDRAEGQSRRARIWPRLRPFASHVAQSTRTWQRMPSSVIRRNPNAARHKRFQRLQGLQGAQYVTRPRLLGSPHLLGCVFTVIYPKSIAFQLAALGNAVSSTEYPLAAVEPAACFKLTACSADDSPAPKAVHSCLARLPSLSNRLRFTRWHRYPSQSKRKTDGLTGRRLGPRLVKSHQNTSSDPFSANAGAAKSLQSLERNLPSNFPEPRR